MSALRRLIVCIAVGGLVAGHSAASSPIEQDPGETHPAEQDPGRQDPGEKEAATRMQQLIDEFIGIMPRNPAALREDEVRRRLAPAALPVLRRIRAFAAEHRDSLLARRVHEFTIYSLVLDEPGLREAVAEDLAGAGRSVQLLLQAAAVIRASTPAERQQAIAGFAKALPAQSKAQQTQPKTLQAHPTDASISRGAAAAACAVQCLAVAAELSADEARMLASSTDVEALEKRLEAVALDSERDPRRLLGRPFVIDGKLLDGSTFSTRSLLGKVVLIDFWASWCGPCIKALPELVAVRQQYANRGLAVVAVSCDRERQALTTFLADHPEVDWPQFFTTDPSGWPQIATEAGVKSIPRLFLVDRKGVLRSVDAGRIDAEGVDVGGGDEGGSGDAKSALEALVLRYLE